jgi:hypothetical protein
MGPSDLLTTELMNIFSGWVFSGLDLHVLSGEIVTVISSCFSLTIFFSIFSRLFYEIYSKDLAYSIIFLNLYGN